MLRLRIITSAVGVPLLILSVVGGEPLFTIFLALIAAGCAIELCQLAPGFKAGHPLFILAVAWALLLSVRHHFGPNLSHDAIITIPLIMSLLFLLLVDGNRRSFVDWSWATGGALYVGWLIGHWGSIYTLPSGMILVLFTMFTTFAYDTGAFFSGRALGRHKLAPTLSASKTWEGVAGGFVSALAVAAIMRAVCASILGDFPLSLGLTLIAGGLIAVAAQVGDLVESAIKRSSKVKDAGSILPGHGGLLDRFDSLLFTGPALYFFIIWVVA
ncbi:MAG: phosphatidate cytidylyltransferase [Dehalococcoidia bacterium]|nr:phosphatidate cytidylyltransferase [Dehalococcoidia bacterium]